MSAFVINKNNKSCDWKLDQRLLTNQNPEFICGIRNRPDFYLYLHTCVQVKQIDSHSRNIHRRSFCLSSSFIYFQYILSPVICLPRITPIASLGFFFFFFFHRRSDFFPRSPFSCSYHVFHQSHFKDPHLHITQKIKKAIALLLALVAYKMCRASLSVITPNPLQARMSSVLYTHTL